MNNTNSTYVPAENGLGYPQALLYIPSILVATALIVFLGISFIRYHIRARNKMGYFRDYVEKNLHVKRERIPGHVISMNRPRIAYDRPTGSEFPREQTNDITFTSGHALPESENSITVENETSIYLKKPRTPKSYFDNEGYEEDISSNKFSRTGSVQRPIRELEMEESDESDNESEKSIPTSCEKVRVVDDKGAHDCGVEIPVGSLCETCQNHLKTRRLKRLTSNDKEKFLDKDDKPKQSPPGAEDDDAFQRSPRPSTHIPPTFFNEEEPKTRKKSVINSRTFPEAKIRLGVFELEPR